MTYDEFEELNWAAAFDDVIDTTGIDDVLEILSGWPFDSHDNPMHTDKIVQWFELMKADKFIKARQVLREVAGVESIGNDWHNRMHQYIRNQTDMKLQERWDMR